jgi:hypothetical protein
MVDPNATDAAAQTDLDAKGVAKTAREEKLKARGHVDRRPMRVDPEGGRA